MNDILLFNQFLMLATVHFFAVASPGPDLAVVIKQSINYGKRHALLTSMGIGSAILVHVFYSAFGVGVLIKQSPMVFNMLKYLCALYLLYIGYKSLRVKVNSTSTITIDRSAKIQHWSKAFNLGFITNVLNPKATLFFLSIFSVVVSQQTPNFWLGIYAIYLSLATTVWFCFVSLILSRDKIRQRFLMIGHYFDWLMGIVLIILAINVAFSTLQ